MLRFSGKQSAFQNKQIVPERLLPTDDYRHSIHDSKGTQLWRAATDQHYTAQLHLIQLHALYRFVQLYLSFTCWMKPSWKPSAPCRLSPSWHTLTDKCSQALQALMAMHLHSLPTITHQHKQHWQTQLCEILDWACCLAQSYRSMPATMCCWQQQG